MNLKKTIKVTGKGSLSVKPDTIRLMINLSDTKEDYNETLTKSTNDTEVIKDCIEKAGFDRKALKTVSFNVDTKYESYTDEKNVWRQKFAGYEYRHEMKLEFEADNGLLGKVLYALANSSLTSEFNIVYTIKDKESAKNELLAKAVKDSRCKAEVLAEAAGVTLGGIIKIDYSWDEVSFVSRPVGNMLRCKASAMEDAAYSMDIEPDDINVSDTVTIIWEIED